jgi:hypothetical protein
MILCTTCGYHFSERRGTLLFESRLSEETALSLLNHLREGCGTRSTSRLVDVSKDTVTRYAKLSGEHAQDIHDELVSFSPSNQRCAFRSIRPGVPKISGHLSERSDEDRVILS